MTRTILSAAALLAVAPFASAQGADHAAMPTPAPEMAQLAYFQGEWTCQGTMLPSPMGPGGPSTGTVAIHSDLGGFWQSGRVRMTTEGMPPMEGMFHATFDPAAKQYVMLWVDSMGGWARSTSKGWEGDTLVYEGEMNMGGEAAMGRDSFTRVDETTMKHGMAMQVAGKWTPMGDEVCRKAKK